MSMMATKTKPLQEREEISKSKVINTKKLGADLANLRQSMKHKKEDEAIVFWCEKPLTQTNLSNMS